MKLIVSNGTLSTSSSTFYIIICVAPMKRPRAPPKKLIESSGGSQSFAAPFRYQMHTQRKRCPPGSSFLFLFFFFSWFDDHQFITGDGRILSSFGVFCRCLEKILLTSPKFRCFPKIIVNNVDDDALLGVDELVLEPSPIKQLLKSPAAAHETWMLIKLLITSTLSAEGVFFF